MAYRYRAIVTLSYVNTSAVLVYQVSSGVTPLLICETPSAKNLDSVQILISTEQMLSLDE